MTKQAPARKKPKRVPPKPVFIVFVLLVILILVSLLGQSYFKRNKRNNLIGPTSSPVSTTLFKASDVMGGFTIEVPAGFEVEQKFTTVTIKNSAGLIRISQNGTNLDNLDEHIKNLEKLNRINFTRDSNLVIFNLKAKMGFIDDQKTYFILNNYNVYSISTNNKSLYLALDQIAQSFRHTPN